MVRIAGLIVAALIAAASATSATADRRVALVIGNAGYDHATPLANPANDARELAAALERLAFDEVTLKFDLSYGDMRRTLADFARTSAGADIALIYFAGHGIEVGGNNYLIPTDAALSHVDDVEFEAVPLATAMHAVNRAGKLKLVILDACRNNPFVSDMEQPGGGRDIGRGLARVNPTGGDTLVAYAAREGTIAADGTGRNSPYAAALVKHIATPGIDVRLLFGRVRDEVMAATGGKQEPFTYGSLGGASIYIAPAEAAPTPEAAPVRPAPAVTSEAAEAWLVVRDTTRASVLNAFLDRYGDTFYGDLARDRLAELDAGGQETALAVPQRPATAKPAKPNLGTIRIGFGSERPYAYEGPDGEALGFVNTIASNVFTAMGYEQVVPVVLDREALIPALQAGEVDAVTDGRYMFESRCDEVAFSNPIALVGDGLLVPAGNPKNIGSYSDVAELGAVLVSGEDYFSIDLAKSYGVAADKIVEVDGPAEIRDEVAAGRADAGALTYFTGTIMARVSGGAVEVTDPGLMPDEIKLMVGVAFNRDDGDLVAAFNDALAGYLGTPEMLSDVASYGYVESLVPRGPRAVFSCPGG